MEEWKDIINHEQYYEVSPYGNIRNKKTGYIIKGDVNNIGYRRVTLYNPFVERVFVHRLVALRFVNGYQEGLVVNHKDGNKQNNMANNLEWVTRSENDLHAFRIGLRKIHPSQFRKKIESYNLITGEVITRYSWIKILYVNFIKAKRLSKV